MKNYDNIPLSKKTLEGMSLNIDDQAFIKRLFDRQDEVTKQYISDTYDLHAKLICDAVKSMLDDFKLELKSIHLDIKEMKTDLKALHLIADQNKSNIDTIKNSLLKHEARISKIEKHLNL